MPSHTDPCVSSVPVASDDKSCLYARTTVDPESRAPPRAITTDLPCLERQARRIEVHGVADTARGEVAIPCAGHGAGLGQLARV